MKVTKLALYHTGLIYSLWTRWRYLLLTILFLLHLPAMSQSSGRRTFLYVNNNDFENSVTGFEVMPDATLRRLPGSPYLTGGLGGKVANTDGLTISKKARALFVTNNLDNTVTGFHIQSDGSLRRFSSGAVPTGGILPAGVVCNKQGSRLFVANTGSDSIASFQVGADGSIRPVPGSPFIANNGPTGMVLNKNAQILFCSNQFTSGISSFSIDTAGRVGLIDTFPTFGVQQQGIVLQRTTSLLYVTGARSNTITGFRVDLNTGRMNILDGSPFFTEGDRPLDIAFDPSGRFLYVSNNGNNTITGYTVGQDGKLQKMSGSPFAATGLGPAGMVFNSSGTLLFVCNGGFAGSRDVSVYKVDSNGKLTPVGSPYPTGSIGIPTGIGIIELG